MSSGVPIDSRPRQSVGTTVVTTQQRWIYRAWAECLGLMHCTLIASLVAAHCYFRAAPVVNLSTLLRSHRGQRSVHKVRSSNRRTTQCTVTQQAADAAVGFLTPSLLGPCVYCSKPRRDQQKGCHPLSRSGIGAIFACCLLVLRYAAWQHGPLASGVQMSTFRGSLRP